jgi:hypothetical protein
MFSSQWTLVPPFADLISDCKPQGTEVVVADGVGVGLPQRSCGAPPPNSMARMKQIVAMMAVIRWRVFRYVVGVPVVPVILVLLWSCLVLSVAAARGKPGANQGQTRGRVLSGHK